jgi:RNA polymerase sigma-70 factor (ECF subfamily)
MALLGQGRHEALAELVRRYQNDLFRFCLHYVRDAERAKDMAQESFIRVYAARGRFDPKRKFRPWVLCIARNLCLNELKRKKAVPMESLEEYATAARNETGEVLRSSSDGPDQLLMAAERRQLLARALERLDDESREIVTLRFFERLQARDIAEVIGSTEGAVRTRLHRILKSLRHVYMTEKDEW